MIVMNKFVPLLFLLFPIVAFSQDFQGTWHWEGEKYEGTAVFDSNKISNTIYFIGTNNKVLETFNFYYIKKNKLYLLNSPISKESNLKEAEAFKIKSFTGKEAVLSGTSGIRNYTKVKEKGLVKQFRAKELYYTNRLNCYSKEESVTNAGACLVLAGISFYATYKDIVTKFGDPINSITNKDNSITFSFLVYPTEKNTPIFEATIAENKIVKLTLSGYKTKDDASFSSIRLGDYYTFVKKRLGVPYYKKEVKAAGDETWVYSPIPITIKLKLNKVSSISIEPFQLK